jgi:hypothetical protein
MFTVLTLTIQGAGSSTVIDASGLNDQVVTVSPGASASLRDLTITGGHAPAGLAGATGQPVLNNNGTNGGTGGAGGNGGGIANSGTLTLDNVTVTGNRAGNGGRGGDGGAGPEDFVHHGGTGGTGGPGGSGGGIYNNGVLTVIDSTISGNHGGDGGDGGLGGPPGTPSGYQGGQGGAGGAGGDGGGIASVGSGNSLTLIGTTVNGNFAGNSGAGGNGGPAPDMIGTYHGGNAGNGANGASGGGVSDVGGAISVSNSTITANAAGDGGASGTPGIGWPLSPDYLGGPGMYGAGGNGGGLRIANPDSALVANDTIAGNVAPAPPFETPGQGAGIWAQSPVTLRNALVASNGPGQNCGTNGGSVDTAFVNGGHNLSFGDTSCPASFATGDPKLKTLQDNGGPTQTMALSSDSAAVDQVPASGAGCPPTDQRGAQRPGGGACDIGAYELTPPVVANVSASSISTSGATLTGDVTADATDATAHFEFGTTTGYGSTVQLPDLAGFVGQPVSTTLTGLLRNTTYHFRLVASSPDGTTASSDQTFTTAGAPAPPQGPQTPILTKLKLRPAKFRTPPRHGRAEGKTGTTISYTDSATATTTLTFLRARAGVRQHGRCARRTGRSHGPRCRVLSRTLSFTHDDARGSNSIRFDRHLSPGRYVLRARPVANGKVGLTVSAVFAILR